MPSAHCSSRYRPGLWCLAAIALGGCAETVDSDEIRTGGIHADMVVLATGDGKSTLTVTLRVGGSRSNTYLELEGDDQLVARLGAEDRELQGQSRALGGHGYATTFATDRGGLSLTVSLERGTADDGAPNSVVTLPDPFRLEEPAPSIQHSRSEDLRVRYAPKGETTTYALQGCTFAVQNPHGTDNKGEFLITKAELRAPETPPPAACAPALELRRTHVGEVDPAFDSGTITAVQQRQVRFELLPSP